MALAAALIVGFIVFMRQTRMGRGLRAIAQDREAALLQGVNVERYGMIGYVFGPLVGTFVLFIAFEFLHGLNEYQPLIYAIIMIGLMVWLPNGLLSLRRPGGSAPGDGPPGSGAGWRRWLQIPESRP